MADQSSRQKPEGIQCEQHGSNEHGSEPHKSSEQHSIMRKYTTPVIHCSYKQNTTRDLLSTSTNAQIYIYIYIYI